MWACEEVVVSQVGNSNDIHKTLCACSPFAQCLCHLALNLKKNVLLRSVCFQRQDWLETGCNELTEYILKSLDLWLYLWYYLQFIIVSPINKIIFLTLFKMNKGTLWRHVWNLYAVKTDPAQQSHFANKEVVVLISIINTCVLSFWEPY